MRKSAPQGYEVKFAGFIGACEKAKIEGIAHMIVSRPQALGDTYDEIMESLWRLSDAELALLIVPE